MLKDEEKARWVEIGKSLDQAWFASIEAKEQPARAIYEDIIKIVGE